MRNVAVVGCGHWGKNHVRKFHELGVLAAICDPSPQVAKAMLANLHNQFPILDTHVENITVDDPHLPAFEELGYLDAFRRIEMYRDG